MEDRLIAKLDSRINSLDSRIGSRIDSLDSRIGSRIDSLDARMSSMETNISSHMSSMEKLMSSLDARMSSMETNISSRMSSMEAHMSSMEAHMSSMEAHMSSMDTRMSELGASMSRLDTGLNGRINVLSLLITKHEEKLDDHFSDLAVRTDLQTHRLDTLDKRIPEHIRRLDDYFTEVSTMIKRADERALTRALNSFLYNGAGKLLPLQPLGSGRVSEDEFPKTKEELEAFSNDQIGDLLKLYEIPNIPAEKEARIGAFLLHVGAGPMLISED